MDSNSPLLDPALEIAEIAVDSLIENDVVREIPFLSTAVAVAKASKSIRDRLFIEKLSKFILDIKSVNQEARQKIYEKIASNPEDAQKVGRTTLTIIERAADLEKAGLIAVLFIAYGHGFLTSAEFRRICEAVDRVFIGDLVEFLETVEQETETLLVSLLPSGFTMVTSARITYGGTGNINYSITKLGNKFRNAYFNGMKLMQTNEGEILD